MPSAARPKSEGRRRHQAARPALPDDPSGAARHAARDARQAPPARQAKGVEARPVADRVAVGPCRAPARRGGGTTETGPPAAGSTSPKMRQRTGGTGPNGRSRQPRGPPLGGVCGVVRAVGKGIGPAPVERAADQQLKAETCHFHPRAIHCSLAPQAHADQTEFRWLWASFRARRPHQPVDQRGSAHATCAGRAAPARPAGPPASRRICTVAAISSASRANSAAGAAPTVPTRSSPAAPRGRGRSS